MNKAQRAARGVRVKQFLEDEDLQLALAEVEAEITAEWRRTPWFWRQRMKWHELRGLDRLRSRLASYAGQAPRN